jgi:hypothetical protein
VGLLYREENDNIKGKLLEVKPAKNRQMGDGMVEKLIWVESKHRYANYMEY